jgi:hypothetical protein
MTPNELRDAGWTLGRSLAVATVLVLTLSVATVGATNAALVQISAADDRIDVSGTTTVDVVVENVDGGVGAYNLTVELSDPDVASITDVELVGGPQLQQVDVQSDGARANLTAALLDTADSGSVTVASVALSGEALGTTNVTVSVNALGNESGTPYEATTQAGSLTVVDIPDDDSDDSDSSSDSPSDQSGSVSDSSDSGDDQSSSADDGAADQSDSTGDSADGQSSSASDSNTQTASPSDEDSGDTAASAVGAQNDVLTSIGPIRFGATTIPAWLVGVALLVPSLFVARRLL